MIPSSPPSAPTGGMFWSTSACWSGRPRSAPRQGGLQRRSDLVEDVLARLQGLLDHPFRGPDRFLEHACRPVLDVNVGITVRTRPSDLPEPRFAAFVDVGPEPFNLTAGLGVTILVLTDGGHDEVEEGVDLVLCVTAEGDRELDPFDFVRTQAHRSTCI